MSALPTPGLPDYLLTTPRIHADPLSFKGVLQRAALKPGRGEWSEEGLIPSTLLETGSLSPESSWNGRGLSGASWNIVAE